MAKGQSRITEETIRKLFPSFHTFFFTDIGDTARGFVILEPMHGMQQVNFSCRKLKKAPKSVLEAKLNPFKNIIKLCEQLFSKA